jgi:ATP-dependent RNA helicase DHX37/DHR1
VIVIDEAHERKLGTDILISLLVKVVKIRAQKALLEFTDADQIDQVQIRPLRLVIMSATLRLNDFLNNPKIFPKRPPLIHIQVRTFPVDVYYNKITQEDYLKDALAKVTKIHKRLP